MVFQQSDFSYVESFCPCISCLLYKFYFVITGKNLICIKTGGTEKKPSLINRLLCELLVLPTDYYSILEKQKVPLTECKVLVSYNSLIAINEEYSVVYKCSFNKIGYQNIKNNYSFLETSGFRKCPKAISISEIDDVVISTESFSGEAFLKAEDLNGDVIGKLLCDLKEMYIGNISRQPFNPEREFGKYDYLFAYYPPSWRDAVLKIQTKIRRLIPNNCPDNQIYKTVIHGDLTYRNILKSNDSITYVDFDRSEISYPEFDFYLFCVDLETHRDGQSTYELLFNNIFKLINGKLALIDEIDYYEILPDFDVNKVFMKEMKLLFLYRTLVLTLQYYTNTTNVPQRIFTQINNGLDKYI